MGRLLIVFGCTAYLAIALGCIFTTQSNTASAEPTAPQPANAVADHSAKLPFRGVAMQLQRVDWIDTEYTKSLNEIAALGADTVLFVVDSHMENGGSSAVYLDMRLVPTPEQLGRLIDHAKGKGLRVVLMPIVLLDRPRGNEWRGTIKPENWPDWWESYRAMLHHFAWIAEAHDVDVLVVGSELVSTEDQLEQWRRTISDVRKTFRGLLTYSSNWDHYREVTFWDQLDLIAMNSYWALGNDSSVTPQEIKQRWNGIQKAVLGFAREKNKPLIFTEVGWCSLGNAAHEPWDYTQYSVPIDLDLQKRLYEGFFDSWHGIEQFGGFMVWEWTCGEGGPRNRGYTPEGKPAEQVLRTWFAKPRWSVK